VCHPRADTLYLSTDYGDHFRPILRGCDTGEIDFSAVPYMRPRCNGNRSILHWMSDIAAIPSTPAARWSTAARACLRPAT
jgi:hypothetical protein